MKKPLKSRPAKELTDEWIESGADLSEWMANPRIVPAMLDPLKVNVDFPAWVVQALDREADRIGIPRQSLIKMWIVERLEAAQSPTAHEFFGRRAARHSSRVRVSGVKR